jgi:hypothetical protein
MRPIHEHLLTMENLHIAIAVLITAVVMAGIGWYFGREQRGRRALGATPIVKVRAVKPGMTVRVTGKLVLGTTTIEAPFSHRPCAHYDAIIEEKYVADWRETWHTIAHETSSCSFFIEDETGTIEVDTTRFDGVVVRDHHRTKGELDVDKAQRFLDRHGQRTSLPPGRMVRYQEGVLEAGETVTVLGTARKSDHGGNHLVLGEGSGPVRASDEPELVR